MSDWQLNESLIATIVPKMQSKTTEQLLQIWNTEVLSEHRSEENLEAMRRVLAQRGTTPPARWHVWLKTNAVSILIIGVAAVMILPDMLGDIWQQKPAGFHSIFALVAVVAFAWSWITQSQKTRDLLATEPEPGQTILRKQMQAYQVEIILLPLWGVALLKFGYQSRFSLFGVEISILHLFSCLVLLPLSYICVSAIKHQILLYYTKGGETRVARGNWARVGGALLLSFCLAAWVFQIIYQKY